MSLSITPRQRLLAAIEYQQPDRLPVYVHGSPAGLHVHGQRLLDRLRALEPDNGATWEGLPGPPEGTVDDAGNYHEYRTDAWGTVWEYRIFGLLGHPAGYPFPSWEVGLTAYLFPGLPDRQSAGWRDQVAATARRREQYLVFDGGMSIFERLHALRPFEDVLCDLASGDVACYAFLDRLVEYFLAVNEALLARGTDVICIGDDWGTQQGPLLSPELFRREFVPRYEQLIAPVKAAGAKVLFHSCGNLGPLLDDLLALDIDLLWPQIGCYDYGELTARLRDRGVALFLHPDRQYLVPRGTPAEIDATIAAYGQRHRELGGGGIYYVEIEDDAPWENVVALLDAVETHR
ncbi:MAG: hypothetical protein IT204_08590 [Fimbriimonadaceae bacterium]|nr:hypothetical protein [Fimbriimonadaceae bacterium]